MFLTYLMSVMMLLKDIMWGEIIKQDHEYFTTFLIFSIIRKQNRHKDSCMNVKKKSFLNPPPPPRKIRILDG